MRSNSVFGKIAFFLLLLLAAGLYAQESFVYDKDLFIHDTKSFIMQPTHWNGWDYVMLGVVGGGSAYMMQFDQQWDKDMQHNRKYARTFPWYVGRYYGDWYTPIVVIGGFGLHGWLDDNNASRRIAFETLQATAYSELVAQVLGVGFGRARPYLNRGAKDFHLFTKVLSIPYHSFPSGHVSDAMAISAVLSRNAPNTALKVAAYLPALCTVGQRAYGHKHWVSDVFAGAAIGYFVGNWISDQHDTKKSHVMVGTGEPYLVYVTIPFP